MRWHIVAALGVAIVSRGLLHAAEPDARTGESAAAAARPWTKLFGDSPEDAFKKAAKEAGSFRLYRGVRDPGAAAAGTLEWHDGFAFEKNALTVSDEDARQLQEIFVSGRVLSPGEIGESCSKFFPDFLLAWGSGEARAAVGMSCQEVILHAGELRTRHYIPPAVYGTLDRILGKYP